MKAIYKTINGRLAFEIQAEDVKTIFRQISEVQEVFDADATCGCCGSTNLRYMARKVDDYDFYELSCKDCSARFAFGQAKKGGALFPKRKDEDGHWLPNRGWSKYQKPGEAAAPIEKKNGVPVYPSWEAAEQSQHWGDDWLLVAGKLYKITDSGSYREIERKEAKQ